MPKYAKSADSLIKVRTPEGNEIEVTERAFNVIYEAQGYQRLGAAEQSEEITEVNAADKLSDEKVDYLTLSREELMEIKNDPLKAYLDEIGIEYKSSATKEDLVDLILGE